MSQEVQALIYDWPLKPSHADTHRRFCDNLFECLNEFAKATLDRDGLPRLHDGSPDYTKISVAEFFMWFAQNTKKQDHIHEET